MTMKELRQFVAMVVSVALAIFVCYEVDTYIHPRQAKAASQFANIICDIPAPVSITAATSTQIFTAGNANMFIYVCAYNLNASAALTFSIIEGTGTACATGTAAMVGTTVAANGPSLGIGGSINYGGGSGMVLKTKVAGDNVCIIPSAGVLSGTMVSTQMAF